MSKGDPNNTIGLQDAWARLMATDDILGDDWVGEASFGYAPVRETTHQHSVPTDVNADMGGIGPPPGMELPLGRQSSLDDWPNDGTTWGRHHTTPRATLRPNGYT